MKIQNNKIKSVTTIVAIVAIASVILGQSTLPAYATMIRDFGPWSLTYSTPSGCNNTQTCASAATSGVNKIIAYATFETDDEVANAVNNDNNVNVGSSPSLTTSASSVYFEVGATYSGDFLPATNGETAYWITNTIFENGSNPVNQCSLPTVTGSGVVSDTVAVSCRMSNSGTNTYYEAPYHGVEAFNLQNSVGTSKADFWNSPYNAQTNYLEICDSC
ncbi:exported protein of unknown function [Nitrosotalea devaniterrae]|uniref:Uncharacterized protein n=1 Tax=Nitrosotalea devaniterrae TaxID=1078905 RepID=A0A128A3I0_9ARCH|nr:exported protein of unknown function [Candidatus Nitrosotalea devanaterra]